MKSINITAIGARGSGKTCFLLGMNYVMSAGVNGYTLTTVDDGIASELRKKWERINETQGASRFPMGTDRNSDYEFNLEYAYQQIRSFNWMDYRGGMVDEVDSENEEEQEEYKQFVNRIKQSECLCIFVDGEALCASEKEIMLRNVKDRCASKINKFISKYKSERKILPPIAIVITKYDKCKDFVQRDQLSEVIKEAFSPLFMADGDSNDVTIIPVSIGMDTENRESTGTLQPINIYKPLFFGIYYPLKRERDELFEKRDNLKNRFAVSQEAYSRLEKKIFRKRKKQKGKEELEKLKKELTELDETVNKYEKYVEKVSSELKGLLVFGHGSQRIWE